MKKVGCFSLFAYDFMFNKNCALAILIDVTLNSHVIDSVGFDWLRICLPKVLDYVFATYLMIYNQLIILIIINIINFII